ANTTGSQSSSRAPHTVCASTGPGWPSSTVALVTSSAAMRAPSTSTPAVTGAVAGSGPAAVTGGASALGVCSFAARENRVVIPPGAAAMAATAGALEATVKPEGASTWLALE